jgi:hypothetical protein
MLLIKILKSKLFSIIKMGEKMNCEAAPSKRSLSRRLGADRHSGRGQALLRATWLPRAQEQELYVSEKARRKDDGNIHDQSAVWLIADVIGQFNASLSADVINTIT